MGSTVGYPPDVKSVRVTYMWTRGDDEDGEWVAMGAGVCTLTSFHFGGLLRKDVSNFVIQIASQQ